MNVLSLFDGISCGQIALNKLNIKYANYFASEINKYAIKVTQHNYPNTKQLGTVLNVKASDLPNIDLLIGGSPCQDLSKANFKGKGLDGKKSGLFWEYVRILKETKPTYFLFENVIMKKKSKDIISNEFGVEPIEINSNLVSAQNRRRLYWTNIPNLTLPIDRKIMLGDIIYDDTYKIFTDERIRNTKKLTKNYVKWDLNGKFHWSQNNRAYFKHKKMCTITHGSPSTKLNIVLDLDNDIYRRIHPIEAERCQTVPDNYTFVDGISSNKRLQMIGNGWTVDVIAHILLQIPTIH